MITHLLSIDKEINKKMADLNTNGGVTPPASATEQQVNNPEVKIDIQSGTEPATVQVATEVDASTPDVLKRTLDKVRDERDAAQKQSKILEGRLEQLEKAAKEREEKEAVASGNFQKLYESKAEELREIATTKSILENDLDNVKATSKKKEELLSSALNKVIDANIAKWPEKARKLVKPVEDVSAEERLAQFLTANDFVADFMNEAPNPGLSPSPQDIRESGREKKVDVREKADSLKASGIYRV